MIQAQEKAKELFRKFESTVNYVVGHSVEEIEEIISNQAKQCALIAVDEMIKEIESIYGKGKSYYWRKVKREIKKL